MDEKEIKINCSLKIGEFHKLHMIVACWLFMGTTITVVMLLGIYTQLIINIWNFCNIYFRARMTKEGRN